MSRPGAHPLDEQCKSVSLYALDVLPLDERIVFERHLEDGCPGCEEELRDFERIAGLLGEKTVPVTPPAALRDELLRRAQDLTEQPEPASAGTKGSILFEQRGLLISRSADMAWDPAGLPGIETKTLFRDAERRYSTHLVRMEPGTTYPSHRHRDAEEVYLLEGDLLLEGQSMQPGDYCHAGPDSVHGLISTKNGAVFLAMSSDHDELLA